MEVFQMLGQGQDTKQIIESLNIRIKTVHVYCTRVREKLGLADHYELLRESFRWWENQGGKKASV